MSAIQACAAFVRSRYSAIITATLIAGLILGFFTSTPGQLIRRVNAPLIAVMIAAMGFTITFRSLGAAARDWRGFSFGLALNFVFAPLVCWVLAAAFLSSHPDLATGLILIGTVPCAGMALVWAGLLEGDVPLASVINAATMVLAPFLIPLLMSLLAGAFVTVSAGQMFLQLTLTVLLPLLAGVIVREALEKRVRVRRILPLMPVVSAAAAALLLFMAINTNVPTIVENAELITPLLTSTVLLFPILFGTAYLVGTRLFSRGRNIAITYSSGMKNLPIAIGIAALSFNGAEMLPVAVAFAFQMLTAVVFYQIFKAKSSPLGHAERVGNWTGLGW